MPHSFAHFKVHGLITMAQLAIAFARPVVVVAVVVFIVAIVALPVVVIVVVIVLRLNLLRTIN